MDKHSRIEHTEAVRIMCIAKHVLSDLSLCEIPRETFDYLINCTVLKMARNE